MKLFTKLTAVALAAGLLSGCASGPDHRVSDYLLCATAGGIVGGLVTGVIDDTDSDKVGIGIAAGAAVATLLCPTVHEPAAPVCAEEPPVGATLDANGCAFDSDNDGVVDGLDHCPDTPAGVEVNAHGCPLDTDQDGVLDYKDLCPGTPIGTEVDADGCPKPGEKILSLNGVHFELNKAVLTPHAEGVLDHAVELLKHTDNVLEVRVEGHTDSTGTEQYNQHLSQKRAEAVVHYLVSQGINGDHLIAVGMGENHPIATNATAEGRALNRRVDFVVSQ